jgi:Lrp/AsnC family transcriptional regulator, leucine-responsive regulatory protein
VPRQPLTYDEIDHRLLDEIQRDATRSLRALGELVGLSASAVQRRIDRYRAAKVLVGNVAVLNPRRTADIVLAIVLVTLDRESTAHHEAFQRRLLSVGEVQQVYDVSGEWDYVVVLATVGMARHHELADRLFKDAPNVKRYTTMFAFNSVRSGSYLPTR